MKNPKKQKEDSPVLIGIVFLGAYSVRLLGLWLAYQLMLLDKGWWGLVILLVSLMVRASYGSDEKKEVEAKPKLNDD